MLKENNFLEVFYSLHEKVQSCGMKGYDPRLLWYLPLAFRYHKNKTKFNNILRRIEVAICRYIPIVVPIYLKLSKIPLVENPYGLGLIIQSYVKVYEKTSDIQWLNFAKIYENRLRLYLVKTKSNGIGISVPLEDASVFNIPASSEVGLAYLELFYATKENYYFDIANKISHSFLNDYKMKENEKGYCIDYYSNNDGMHVLNANALAMEVIHRVNKINKIEGIISIIKKMFEFNFFYIKNYDLLPYAGVEDKLLNSNWNCYDVYHTGFTIRSMYYVASDISDLCYAHKNLYKTYSLMKENFLNRNGYITLLRNSKIVDIHGVAEFARCVAIFDINNSDSEIVIKNFNYMYVGDSFYYQRGVVDAVFYMPRWGHAPMMLAISELL